MDILSKIINKFKSLKILVVGDIMLDKYIYSEINRMSPEAPVPILDVKKIDYFLGGAANVSRNIKTLGTNVILAGVIGPEEEGQTLKHLLKKDKINIKGLIVDKKRRTTVKTRIIFKNKHFVRIDLEDRNLISHSIEAKIFDLVRNQIKNINAIIISDYAKGVITPILAQKIINISEKNNILCLVDPKGKNYLKYSGCNIITPNQKELLEFLDLKINSESQFLKAGREFLSRVNCDSVLVTRHDKGMISFSRKDRSFHFPAVNKNAVDVSGAGDTAIAFLTLSLASGANIEEAMIIASYACGVAVGKTGTGIVTAKELEQNIKNIDAKSKNQKSKRTC